MLRVFTRCLSVAAGAFLFVAGLAAVASAAPPVPEIDAGTMVSALTVLSGGLLILNGRRRRA